MILGKARFGLLAEYIAILYYKIKLYSVLHHRLRSPLGEIDIILIRCRQIVFAEVKARSNDYDDILLTHKQRNRITRAAENFLARHQQYNGYDVRFDLVLIKPYSLPKIIRNAWGKE